MYRWTLLALISIAVDRPLGAQLRADPGTVINGKVAVKVAVTLSDDDTPYAPLSNLQLRFFRSATDSVVVRTDDAGVATTLLSPGDYRLVTGAPTEWTGDGKIRHPSLQGFRTDRRPADVRREHEADSTG